MYPFVNEKTPPAKITNGIDWILSKTVLKLIPQTVTPNGITCFRFAAIPFIIYFLAIADYKTAAVIFAVAAFSDLIDGALARTTNRITDWGKLYDPLADKLLIGTTAALLISKFISHFLALAIIALECLIIVGAFWRRKHLGKELRARMAGKIKMVLQSFGVGFLLLFAIFGAPILYAISFWLLIFALVFAILSLFVYHSI